MDADLLVQIERIVTTVVTGVENRIRQDLGTKIEETRRYSGVLHEDVLHKIDLLAEGHQSLDQKIDRLDAKMENGFLETRAVIQLSYRQLQQRMDTLEQRVETIEKRLGMSA